jgi:hypothetical protein
MKKITIILSACLLIISCSGSGNSDGKPAAASSEMAVYKKGGFDAHTILELYFLMGEGFIASDVNIVNEIGGQYFNVVRQKEFDRLETIRGLLNEMMMDDTLEGKRAIYSKLTEELYQMVKAGKIGEGELFLLHCPMAFDNQGANWISPRKDIMNPYFGDKMLKCGHVKEEL